METSKRKYVNTPVDDELLEKIDLMAKSQENTRAGIMRLAVRQLWKVLRATDPKESDKTAKK